jgi:GNAT superfamily N-acetyltransferase
MEVARAHIERLAPEEREHVVDVLCESFREYPVMQFVLGPEEGQEARRRSLIGFFTDVRFAMEWPVLGVREGGRLVAAALVNEPHDRSFLQRFEDGITWVRSELGEAAFTRLERFEKAAEINEPAQSHYFVGMLGVIPAEQGKGHARRLLEHVRRLSMDAGCAGVALSTEDARNIPFYEHMGFEIVGSAEVDDIPTWSLWWPNEKGA